MSKHPELTRDLLHEGVSYMCAYNRLTLGWSLERAVSEKPRRRDTTKLYNAAKARRERIKKRILQPRKPARRYYKPHSTRQPSNAPPHIQKLLASYCSKFIKTGELDRAMFDKLQAYALSQRKPHGIPSAPTAPHAPANGFGCPAGTGTGGRDQVAPGAGPHVFEQRAADESRLEATSHGAGRAGDISCSETYGASGE